MIDHRERPSQHGAILGDALARIAAAGREASPVALPDMCATCAFRPGCMTNQMAATGKVALDCVLGIDDAKFACHHGMRDGAPRRLCVGYHAAGLAPWSLTKEVLLAAAVKLDEVRDRPDDVRAAFDAWLARVDPDRRMNDYDLARAFERERKGV